MNKLLKNYSYTMTSLKSAFLNVYNLSGGKRNYDVSSIISKSDKMSIEEDWKCVGQDIREAIERYSNNGR